MTHRSFSPPTSLALAAVTILLSCFLAVGCGNKPDNNPDNGVANPCANVTCKANEVCQNGQCVDSSKGGSCNSVICEGDAQCSEGKCLCGTTECESGKICQSGSCVDKPTSCDNVTCEGDAVCSNGTCLCNGNACSNNQVCRGNVCLDKCGSTECPSGEGCYKDKNKCVSKCDTTCGGVGEKCVNNLCIDLCEGVTCNNGTEQCIDGTCVPKVTDSCNNWTNVTEIPPLTNDTFNESIILDFSSEGELNTSSEASLTECAHGLVDNNYSKQELKGTYKRKVLKFVLPNPSTLQINLSYISPSTSAAGLFVKLFKGCDTSKTVEGCTFSTEIYDARLYQTESIQLPASTYYLIVESTQPSEKVAFTINGQIIKADIASSPCKLNRMSCDAGKVVSCSLPPISTPTDPLVETKLGCIDNQCTEFTEYAATCRGAYCSSPIEIDGTTAGVHNFKGDIGDYRLNEEFAPDDPSCDVSGLKKAPKVIFFHVSNLKKDQEVIFTSRVDATTDTALYDILFKSTCSEGGICSYANHDTTSNSNKHKYKATKNGDSVFIVVYRSTEAFPSGPEPFEYSIDVKAAP